MTKKACFRRRVIIAAVVLSIFGQFSARADVWTDCGFSIPNNEFTAAGYFDAAHNKTLYWAGFALNGGFVDSNPNDVLKDTDIYGDIGVSGNGNISLQNGFKVHKGFAGRGGNVYYHTGGTFKRSGETVIEGDVVSDTNADTILNKGFNDALAASDYAFGLAATQGISTVSLKNQNMTVSLTATCNVLQLQNFVIQGGTFTLVGTAMQSIVINVSGDFVMNGGAQIVLQGGLQWDNVLLNVHGQGNVVSLDQAAYVRGILLAPKRHVKIKGASTVEGITIGEKIEIASHSRLIHPSVASP